MDEAELAELEANNEKRSIALVKGELGMQVGVPPGTFELLRVTIYLEALMTPGKRHIAKVKVATQVAEVLTNMERSVREAVIANGGIPHNNGAVDLAQVHSINKQVERQKQ